ncbi:MarR family winged helix-turn-helix transcriptional regulator [Paraburkholderia phosphatilytica]|uniref:MarR family winged helix-turn-helix transcriptional regulator n=1 Tax=Paraburkholderia phosphatilytica TaxID=2282883 RepID=UPI000E53B721|nr:MarR family transcriptional regulator [Paraburkholderia phosphatilytica]
MKHYTKENFAIAKSVGFAINRARNLILMEMDAALADLEISGQNIGIMMALYRGVASTPFELSKLLGTDTGLMTRMLDRLEKRGLLVRTRSIEDRRVVKLALTAKGKDVAEQIPDRAPDVLNERLKDFSKAEFNEFLRLLNKFIGEQIDK